MLCCWLLLSSFRLSTCGAHKRTWQSIERVALALNFAPPRSPPRDHRQHRRRPHGPCPRSRRDTVCCCCYCVGGTERNNRWWNDRAPATAVLPSRIPRGVSMPPTSEAEGSRPDASVDRIVCRSHRLIDHQWAAPTHLPWAHLPTVAAAASACGHQRRPDLRSLMKGLLSSKRM